MSEAVVTLKKGGGRTLKQGGPWIYDNEVTPCWEHLKTETWFWSMILTGIRWEEDSSTAIRS